MKKVLTLLFSLVTITALAQQPQRAYKHPIPNASSAYSFKSVVIDSALGLPRYPLKLSAEQIKYLGRQNDALMFADTLAGIVYWYNPHEDAVKVLGGSGGGGGNVDLSNYYNKTQSDARYLQTYIESDPTFLASAANGITGSNITNWNTAFSSLNNYLLKSDTVGKWQAKGDYSYHLPYNGNANYYLGGDTILHALPTAGSGATPGDTATLNVHTTSFNNLLYAAINHTHSFSSLTSKPTTLSGYGIIDAYPLTGNPSGFLTAYTEADPVWSAVSGSYYTKTQADARYLQSYTESDPLALKISNNLSDLTNTTTARTNLGLGSLATKSSLLTSDIPDISTTYATQSQLTTTNGNVSSNTTALAGKQATLVSGTNIKTINGGSLLGSGNINAGNALYLGSYTKTNRDAISSPAAGSQIFNTDDGWYEYYDAFWGWMPMAITNEWRKRYGWEYFNDFLNSGSDNVLGQSTANGGSVAFNVPLAGITSESSSFITLNLLTNANARSGYSTGATTVLLGSGTTVFETRIQMNTLSTSTDRYQLFAGFVDAPAAVDQVDAVYLLYDEGGATAGSAASGNWQLVTSSNSVRTFVTSSSTVAATTWYNLRIEVNAAGTLATFYVNGTSIGTITTNIPTAAARVTGFGVAAIKSVGTSNRFFELDYIQAKQKFTTAR